jgi:hypothetical protein
VLFEHAVVQTAGPSAVRRGWIPGLLEIQIPLFTGKKIPIQPFFAKIRLENIRWLRYLRDELPTLTVEITAELTAELTGE